MAGCASMFVSASGLSCGCAAVPQIPGVSTAGPAGRPPAGPTGVPRGCGWMLMGRASDTPPSARTWVTEGSARTAPTWAPVRRTVRVSGTRVRARTLTWNAASSDVTARCDARTRARSLADATLALGDLMNTTYDRVRAADPPATASAGAAGTARTAEVSKPMPSATAPTARHLAPRRVIAFVRARYGISVPLSSWCAARSGPGEPVGEVRDHDRRGDRTAVWRRLGLMVARLT